MGWRTTVHTIAQSDIASLRKAGLSQLVDRARDKMHALAELEDPTQHPKVTRLKYSAPGWFRFRDGNLRIIFRFTKSTAEMDRADTMQITMIDLRDDDTYQSELVRRYKLLEG